MVSPSSLTTENLESRGKSGAGARETLTAVATDAVDAGYSNERPSRSAWHSETPPSGVLTGVLGELAFYYGAYCLYHCSAPTCRGGCGEHA